MLCPECRNPNLTENDFYHTWKPPSKLCRKCYRNQINLRVLQDAQVKDPDKAVRIESYRSERELRGPAPVGHHWCGKCQSFRPTISFHSEAIKRSGWCRGCGSKVSVIRSMNLKKRAIAHMGGACQRCGFAGHWAAFVFHHRDPAKKETGWGGDGMRKHTWDKIVPELEKCTLLCQCCHAIVHSRFDENGNDNPEYVAT